MKNLRYVKIPKYENDIFNNVCDKVENPTFNEKIWGVSPLERIKQQKGLSMFGDRDKDRVINILDPNPLNRKIK